MTEPTPPTSTKHVYGIRWEMGNRYLLTRFELPSTVSDPAVLDQVRIYAKLSHAKVTCVFRTRPSGPNLLSDTRDIPLEDPARGGDSRNPYRAIKALVGHRNSTEQGIEFTVKVPWIKDDAMRSLHALLETRALIGPDGHSPSAGLNMTEGIQRKRNASL